MKGFVGRIGRRSPRYSSVVFVDTQLSAHKCTVLLRHLGLEAIALHGGCRSCWHCSLINGFERVDWTSVERS